MNKFLLASTISMISWAALAAPVEVQQISADQGAETQTAPAVYQKQTVVRYNVPTCKNCQTTTTVSRTVNETEPAATSVPCTSSRCSTCTSCGENAVAAAPVYRQKAKSCVFDNHKYAIANPLFVLREGQFSSDTVLGVQVQPKVLDSDDVERRHNSWEAAEQLMFGLTDWLSIKLQGEYTHRRPKKSAWNIEGTAVPRYYSYRGTVGLQAHALDFCNFDLMLGVDGSWVKTGYKWKTDIGTFKESGDYKLITPYALMGGQITKYLTPYLKAGYTFAMDIDKNVSCVEDHYVLQPGLYIQPNKYFAIHPYLIKAEHQKIEWNLALDFYPYQNLAVGIEGSAVGLGKHPMDAYGLAGHVKMTF